MTAPYLPPLKSVEGVTLREALTYERTVDDGEEVPPPGRGPEPPSVDLAFHAGPWRKRLVEQPAGAIQYWPVRRPKFNTAAFTHVRLVCQVRVEGAPTAYASLEYSADKSTWAAPGLEGAPVTVSFAAVSGDGDTVSFSTPLADAARADVWWRVRAVGGDGVESPEIAGLSAQFETSPTAATQRWFWREGTPSEIPTLDAYVGSTRRSVCTPEKTLTPFLTPEAEDVRDNAMILSLTKGSGASVALEGTTTSTPSDWYGPLARFVGPALLAQTVPPHLYKVACIGQVVSAVPDAGYVHVRFGYYRPSTGEMVAAEQTTNTDAWFRHTAKGKVLMVPLGAVAVEQGDRPVLDVWGSIASGCGAGGHAQAFPLWVLFDGATEEIVNDADMTGTHPASYIETPRLRLVDGAP